MFQHVQLAQHSFIHSFKRLVSAVLQPRSSVRVLLRDRCSTIPADG